MSSVEASGVEIERSAAELVPISGIARDSGLTVSALRFYDGAGLLVPAEVDPRTGYRWYAPEQVAAARLLARMRRVGMPLRDIAAVLAHRDDADRAGAVLDRHVRRLEDGLALARREVATIRSLLGSLEDHMTRTDIRLEAADLGAALRSVRFAIGSDPELPMLGGVLVDVDGDQPERVRFVATDRYRLAVASPAAQVVGPAVSVIAPTPFVAEVLELLGTAAGEATVRIDGDHIVVRTSAGERSARRLDHDFPDYRALASVETAHRVTVDVAAFRTSVSAAAVRPARREQDAADYPLVVLGVDEGGTVEVGSGGRDLAVGVNREFLLEAVDAVGADQLVLELHTPLTPLAIRDPAAPGTFSILMPARVPSP